MIQGDKEGLLYQKVIDRNIFKLIEMGIDLKVYFKSNMPVRKFYGEDFPKNHPNSDFMFGKTDKLESIREL